MENNKIKVIKYETPIFNNQLSMSSVYFFESFLTTAYAIVEEVLYEDTDGTKVGCYNPISNRRMSTYLESEEVVKEFDTEAEAVQYIESQQLLEKQRVERICIELKAHIDKFFETKSE
jgi:hypothetical protein